MSYTGWLILWFAGALLTLGPAVHSFGPNKDLDEGTKIVAITMVTLFWPIALTWGCLAAWVKIWSGK